MCECVCVHMCIHFYSVLQNWEVLLIATCYIIRSGSWFSSKQCPHSSLLGREARKAAVTHGGLVLQQLLNDLNQLLLLLRVHTGGGIQPPQSHSVHTHTHTHYRAAMP